MIDNEKLLEAIHEVAAQMPKKRDLVIHTGQKGAEAFHRSIEDLFLIQQIDHLRGTGVFDSETARGLKKLLKTDYEPDRQIVRAAVNANQPQPETFRWNVAGMQVQVQGSEHIEEDKFIIRERNEFNI